MIHWQPGMTIDEVEEQVIKACYIHFEKNKTKTASSLGIAIRTLDAKLAKYKAKEEENDTGNITDQN